MKVLIILVFGLAILNTGCHIEDCDDCYCTDNIVYRDIDYPPVPPTGLVSTTHDEYVKLSWNSNYETDIDGYNVYYALDENSDFESIKECVNKLGKEFGIS